MICFGLKAIDNENTYFISFIKLRMKITKAYAIQPKFLKSLTRGFVTFKGSKGVVFQSTFVGQIFKI